MDLSGKLERTQVFGCGERACSRGSQVNAICGKTNGRQRAARHFATCPVFVLCVCGCVVWRYMKEVLITTSHLCLVSRFLIIGHGRGFEKKRRASKNNYL